TAMDPAQTYLLKHTTRTVKVTIPAVEYRVDVNTLSRVPAEALGLNEIGRIAFEATQPLYLDAYAKNRFTGSFILIHPPSHATVAAGMVIDRLPEASRPAPVTPLAPSRATNVRAEVGRVARADRERRLGQRALTLWFTGLSGSGKSTLAQELERRLAAAGHHGSILDGDNLRLGLTRDLGFAAADRTENIRRAAEVARLFNDAGLIALVPVISPFRADREHARRIIGPDRFLEIYVS